LAKDGNAEARAMATLYHYTDQTGLDGILGSMVLLASTTVGHPRDVRYVNGQYLTDIAPGAKTPAQLSRALFGHPFLGQRCTHYVEIDVAGLNVRPGRSSVYVVPNDQSLDLNGRLVRSGRN
jgi:hypothetical protein